MTSDIKQFVNGCLRIKKYLNKRAGENKLTVIAPGDSPSKIVKFLEKTKSCPNCVFISFPISGIGGSDGNKTEKDNQKIKEYIKTQLPKTLAIENTVFMDFINSGDTLQHIIISCKEKYKISPVIIKKILYELDFSYHEMSTYFINKEIKLPPYKNKKYILNCRSFFNGNIYYLMAAENTNTRCLPKYNPIHPSKNVTINSSKTGCNKFVANAIIFYKKVLIKTNPIQKLI